MWWGIRRLGKLIGRWWPYWNALCACLIGCRGRPASGSLLLLRQKKVTKKRRPRCAALRVPSVWPTNWASAQLALAGHTNRALPRSSDRAQPKAPNLLAKPKRRRGEAGGSSTLVAQKNSTASRVVKEHPPLQGEGQGGDGFDFESPRSTAEQHRQAGGSRRALSERAARVAQPPGLASSAGNPARGGGWGSPSLVYLSWRSKKGKQPPGCPRQSNIARSAQNSTNPQHAAQCPLVIAPYTGWQAKNMYAVGILLMDVANKLRVFAHHDHRFPRLAARRFSTRNRMRRSLLIHPRRHRIPLDQAIAIHAQP